MFMGYRHTDVRKISPLFVFGHGRSYTTVDFQNLKIDIEATRNVTLVKGRNSGQVAVNAVVQAYISKRNFSVPVPVKPLRGFTKTSCTPELSTIATVVLDKALACSYYNISISKWTVEKGEYEILIRTSSEQIVAVRSFIIEDTVYLPPIDQLLW